MFYLLLHKIIPLFDSLEECTWNYSEPGHGKGAPDGIGATLKKTCNKIVSCDKDISNYDQFLEAVQIEIKSIKILSVDAINEGLEEEMKKANPPTVKGTILVRQVVWSMVYSKDCLIFNELSCFDCHGMCEHFHLFQEKYAYDDTDLESDSVDEPVSVASNIESEVISPNVEPNDSFAVNDYIIVRFSLEEISGERKFVGKIVDIIDNSDYSVSLWRSKNTRQNLVYTVYTHIPLLKIRLQ